MNQRIATEDETVNTFVLFAGEFFYADFMVLDPPYAGRDSHGHMSIHTELVGAKWRL